MSERTKKILLVVLFLVVSILLALALYFVFFRPTPPPVVVIPEDQFPGGLPSEPTDERPVTPEQPPSILPPSGIVVPPETLITSSTQPTITTTASGGIVVPQKLIDRNATFVTRGADGQSVNFYDETTGLFNRLRPNGDIETLTTRSFRNVGTVAWSPVSDKAVIEFRDGSNIIYNFDTNESFTLPTQYEDFSFSPTGVQIAAKDLKLDQEDRWLVVVDDQGRNKQLVEHLGRNESRVQVKWSPNTSIVATSAMSIDANRAEVTFLTKNGSQLNKAIVQGRNLQYNYSPSGNQMVYSVYNATSNYLPTLWLTTTSPTGIDTNRINTGLNTWASKCTYASEATMYCAVPREIGQYSGILPSNNTSEDDIYIINTRTGDARLAAQPLVPTRIESMIINSDSSTLYYVDAETKSVSKINL